MFINKRQKLPQPAIDPKEKGLTKIHQKSNRDAKFGSSIPAKTIEKQTDSKKTLDWDDISLSSEDSKSFQRFLKKNSDEEKEQEKKSTIGKDKTTIAAKINPSERPKTSRNVLDKNISALKPQLSSSSALNRLAMIEARFKDRQQSHSQNKVAMSSSDFDLDVSSDSEVKRGIGKSNVKLRETVKKSQKSKSTGLMNHHNILTLDDETETEDDASEKMRFVKQFSNVQSSNDVESSLQKGQNIMKVHTSSEFEESEGPEITDSRHFIKRPGSPKKVTFAADLVRSSDLEQSYDDYITMSEKSEPVSLDEILPSKLHNIMSLDDLLPTHKTQNKSSHNDARPTSALGFAGLQSVEDLLPMGEELEVKSSNEFVSSMEEDIKEASLKSTDDSSVEDNFQNLRSFDDLQVLGSDEPSEKLKNETTNVFKAKTSVEESDSEEEIKSESVKYSEDFHSSDEDTLKDTESISQDIEQSVSSIASSVPDKYSSDEKSISYSSSFISTESSSSSTISTVTPKPHKKHKTKNFITIETQTDIASREWVPGSVFNIKSFTPSRLIDDEVLDVLSTYNPGTLALQDLLRQQVSLTQEFIARSRRLHELATSSIPCDYVYGEINEESLARLKSIWHAQDQAKSH